MYLPPLALSRSLSLSYTHTCIHKHTLSVSVCQSVCFRLDLRLSRLNADKPQEGEISTGADTNKQAYKQINKQDL